MELLVLLDYVLLGLAGWALIDAATRKPDAFVAAGRQTKQIWLAILVACTVIALFVGAFSIFGAAAAVGAIVYLGDVRPAVRELSTGGW